MNANRPIPEARPSRGHAKKTTPAVLALAGLGPQAPVGLGPAPVPALDAPWAAGLALVGLVPALVLYRRLQRPDVLDHDHREAILDHVVRDPPATVGELAGILDLDYKTVDHHVRVLEDFGLVETRRRGQLRELYPSDEAPPELPEPLTGEHETALALLHLVTRRPGITQTEAADRLDVARSTVHWHVERLAEKGLLRSPEGAPGLEAGPALDDVEDVLGSQARGVPAS